MKKLALTNLIILIAIKIVSACSYAPEPGYEAPQFEKLDGFYFLSAFALFAPIIYLYYLRERRGRWAIITSAVSLVLFIPALIFTALRFAICNFFIEPVQMLIRAELFLMSLIFTIQLFSWITERNSIKT